MPARARTVAQAVAFVAVVALLALLVWKVAFEGSADARVGEPAPAFDLKLLNTDRAGERLTLESLRGRPVVLNFWASWCDPCKDEAPLLQDAYDKYGDDGLVVVGVDAQDLEPDARTFMKRYGVGYPVVHDGPGSLIGRYGVTGFPETYFIDREGKIAAEKMVGGISEANVDEFKSRIHATLGARS